MDSQPEEMVSGKFFLKWARGVGIAGLLVASGMSAQAQEPSAPAADNTQPRTSESVEASSAAPAPAETATAVVPNNAEPLPEKKLTNIPVKATEAKPETTGADDDQKQELDEVIVTATKRNQSVRKIPATITALDGKELEAVNARQLEDFISQVPGINLQNAVADKKQQISIRGVGPSDGANQTTGVLLDDVPLTDPYGTFAVADPDPYDMKNVSVLKGPQGTLFGASALNGAIRYEQNLPVLEEWSGRTFAHYQTLKEGSSEPSFGLVLNAPIGSEAAVRVNGVYQNIPGLIDYNTPGRPFLKDGDVAVKWTGRALARWEPLDRLSLNVSYMQQQRTSDELSFVNNQRGELVRDDAPTTSPKSVEFNVATLDMRYEFDWATLVSQTSRQGKTTLQNINASYTAGDDTANKGIDSVHAVQDVYTTGYLQEFRLVSSGEGLWNWLAGVFYDKYSADIDSDIYVANTNALALIPGAGNLTVLTEAAFSDRGVSLARQKFQPLAATEQALFGEISRTLFSDWTATFGARLYKSQVGGTAITTGLLSTAFQPANAPETLEVKGQGFSPRFALTWQASRDLFFYSNVARGFQFGGVNLQPVVLPVVDGDPHPTFKSSTLWSYEIGVRTDWFDRSLRLDLTAFHLDWKEAQLFQLTSSGVGGYVDNVGAVKSDGLEATLRYLTPIPGLTITSAASYIVIQTAESFTDAAGAEIPAGTDMPNAPQLQTSSSLTYARPFFNWKTSAALGHTHQSKAFNDLGHHYVIANYDAFSFNLNIGRPDLSFAPSLTFGVTNLTDVRAINGVASGAKGAFTEKPTSYVRPRSFNLRLDFEF